MTTQEQISKLQGLLAKIQKNGAKPRINAPTPAWVAAAPIAAAAPVAAATPPAAAAPIAAAAPPAAFAPQPAPPPVAFASPAPLPAAPPPAHFVASAASAPAASPDDQSIDDLLDGSPMPVDVDIPFDTLPPGADIAVPPSFAPEADPIPLVSVAAEQAAPPESDDAFSLESEVSEVRAALIPREEEAEVTVAAIEAEAEAVATEELSEDDLVELTESAPPPAVEAEGDVDIDFSDEDDRPPASSQRSKVASTMDEALVAAAAQLDAEREVPIKTPPPESGPQAAPAPTGLAAPAAPDVDSLLGEELDIPTRGAGFGHAALVPTPEQLGQTIDLDEARGPSLELAEPPQSSAPPAGVEELEMALPPREVVGGYDDSLMPPPEARDDLAAHRRRLEDDIAPPPESLAQLPPLSAGPRAEIVPIAPVAAAPSAPEVLARSAPSGRPEAFTSAREAFRPTSFVELLDASLALGSP